MAVAEGPDVVGKVKWGATSTHVVWQQTFEGCEPCSVPPPQESAARSPVPIVQERRAVQCTPAPPPPRACACLLPSTP